MALLHMDPGFATRYVNEGFSGGEKKRLEMLQMAVIGPSLAILDETDSGLDIDALKNVAEGINATLSPEMGVLMITHYQRMLNYVKPQFVHVLLDGRIVMSGGEELSHQLEANGYDWVREQVGLPAGVGDEASAPGPVEARSPPRWPSSRQAPGSSTGRRCVPTSRSSSARPARGSRSPTSTRPPRRRSRDRSSTRSPTPMPTTTPTSIAVSTS